MSTHVLALPPAPRPARPRMLMVGTAFAVAAGAMLVAGLCGIFLHFRAEAGSSAAWLPEGLVIPEIAANTAFATLVCSSVTAQWAAWAVARDDRRHAALALGTTALFGFAFLNSMAFCISQMKLIPASESIGRYSVLTLSLLGTQIVLTSAGMLFLGLMAFRSLGGREDAKRHEGISAAVMFWHFVVLAFCCGVWVVVFQLK